jgi:type IV secretory pathway VirB4 component
MKLNPFLLPKDKKGHYLLSEDKKTFMIAVMTIMWKKEGEELTKEQEAILTQFIVRYYQWVNKSIDEGVNHIPRLDRFVDFIERDHEHRMSKDLKYKEFIKFFDLPSLMLVLNDFTHGGSYGEIFSSEGSIDIRDMQLICFDLSNVRSNPTLYPIVSLIIIELVLDKINYFKDIRKELIMDEAFEFLKGSMAAFIEKMYRQIRKANGAVTIATQGVSELKKSDQGPAIVQNASIKILLDHSAASNTIPDVQEFLGLTDNEVMKLKSIRKAGSWREFLIKRMDASDVFSIDVGPHAALAFSTDPDDLNKISEMEKRFENKNLIFDQIVEDSLKGKQ